MSFDATLVERNKGATYYWSKCLWQPGVAWKHVMQIIEQGERKKTITITFFDLKKALKPGNNQKSPQFNGWCAVSGSKAAVRRGLWVAQGLQWDTTRRVLTSPYMYPTLLALLPTPPFPSSINPGSSWQCDSCCWWRSIRWQRSWPRKFIVRTWIGPLLN